MMRTACSSRNAFNQRIIEKPIYLAESPPSQSADAQCRSGTCTIEGERVELSVIQIKKMQKQELI